MTDPDTIASAVLRHIDDATKPDDSLKLPPTDAQVFDGVPPALPEEITAKIERQNGNDDNWDEEKTAVVEVPQFRKPHDPTGCMM